MTSASLVRVSYDAVVAVIAGTSAIATTDQTARPVGLAKLDCDVYSFRGGPDGGALLSFSIGGTSRSPEIPIVPRLRVI